jgi:hypothetical protein
MQQSIHLAMAPLPQLRNNLSLLGRFPLVCNKQCHQLVLLL